MCRRRFLFGAAATILGIVLAMVVAEVVVRLGGLDDYELELRKDPNLESTEFAMISTMKGNPALGGGTTIAIYGFREVGSDKMSGSYVQSSMASAPCPTPRPSSA